jgi:hypothetical protein
VADWPDVTYRVDANDTITEVGAEWDRTARLNEANRLVAERIVGTRLYTHVSGDVCRSYVWTMFDAVRKLGKPVVRPYRCDSPDCQRHMEMRISPEPGDGLLLEHRLLRATHLAVPVRFVAGAGSGMPVLRCSMCNRIKIARQWCEPAELEPAATSEPATIRVVYGVCEICRDAARLPLSTP